MSTTTTDTGSPARRNRLVYGGLWAIAALGYAGFIAAGRGLVAVAVFALFGLAAVGVQYRSDAPLFDERDEELLSRASGLTIRALGLVSAVLFPTLVVLDALDRWSWTPFMAGVGVTVLVVYAGFFASYGVLRARR